MKKPKSTSSVPRGGWSVTLEGLGPEIRSIHFSEFIQMVRQRLEANGKDTHGWRDEVIDLMCEQRPDIDCEDEDDLPTRAITGSDIRKYIRTLYEAWKSGAEAVSHEEQDRRASICSTCPKRGHVSCFGGCGPLAQMLSELILGAKAKVYPELHKTGCSVCGCECSSLVIWPLDVLQKADEITKFPVADFPWHCWRYPHQPPENIPPKELPSSPHPES